MKSSFSGDYGGARYEQGTNTLLMKEQLDIDIATALIAYGHVSNVIDVGGGTGALAKRIQRSAEIAKASPPSYTVMDTSSKQLHVAARKGIPVIQLSTTSSLKAFNSVFENKPQFDAAVMENSLYAVTSGATNIEQANVARTRALENIATVLSTDGLLVISDPIVKDKQSLLKNIPRYIDREKKLAMSNNGMTEFGAALYVLRKLTDKHVLNSLKQTAKLAKSTTRFENTEELIGFVEGTGLFEVVPESVRSDAYLGDNAFVVFRRTEKQVVEPVVEVSENQQLNPSRISFEGDPQHWTPSQREMYLRLEEKSFAAYGAEAAERAEGSVFIEDFTRSANHEDIMNNKDLIRIDKVWSTFYFDKSEEPFAFLNLIEVEVLKSFTWHGIEIPQGKLIIPRKMMKDKDYVARTTPYWDDVYEYVARSTQECGHVVVAMHMQPDSLRSIVRSKLLVPGFHAENHFVQAPGQSTRFEILYRLNQLPVKIQEMVLTSLFGKKSKEIKGQLQRMTELLSVIRSCRTAFTPDDSTMKTGFVVVQFSA